MLDWAARIDDLAALLADQYSMEDRGALEVLLSALVACPRTHAVWLVLETDWYARDCLSAWFSFGATWVPRSLAQIRGRQPWRAIEAMVMELLDEPEMEQLFIEPDFERYPRYSRSNAVYILDRSLRVRTILRRTGRALLPLDRREEDRRSDELAAALEKVTADRVQARPVDPPRFVEPPDFIYRAELVHRLAPWFRDWGVFLRALAAVGIRHAWLYGRAETDERDWAVMARVAADSVPPWIAKAIRMLLENPAQPATLEKHMALEEKSRRSGHGAHRELMRLRRANLIHWNIQKMHWAIVAEHRRALAELLDGQAFGAACAAQVK